MDLYYCDFFNSVFVKLIDVPNNNKYWKASRSGVINVNCVLKIALFISIIQSAYKYIIY